MNKSVSSLMLALVCVATAGTAAAQDSAANLSKQVVQVSANHLQTPVMSHEVASLIQTLQKAQMQYRRSGSSQDLARVHAMRTELAARGYGRLTISAPVAGYESEFTNVMEDERTVRVSSAVQ